MAESSKLRLVCCPKCDNLLPKLADYSVYQCGGCGAVLRAKHQVYVSGSLSDEGKVGRDSAKLDKGLVVVVDTSDVVNVKSNSGLSIVESERDIKKTPTVVPNFKIPNFNNP